MALKIALESIEGVDDAFKPLYKELDGKYVLDVEGVDDHPTVRGLKSAHEAQKARNQELTGKLTELEGKVKELPEDFDASKWLEFKVSAEQNKDKKDKDVANLQAMFDTRVQNLEQKHKADMLEKETAVGALNKQLDDLVVSTQLTGLLIEANVSKDLLEAAKLVVGRKVKVEPNEATGDRKVVVETNIGDQPLKDYVRAWAETDGKAFLAKPTGVGAPGSGTNGRHMAENPFTATNWNKTAQTRIPVEKREDFARAAGFKNYQTAIMSSKPVTTAA